ncbi:hypothetical protein OHA71_36705 [Streptomyces sp. NBC_00444]|uniref:hypothetical protein n=1 Tax=Streptomyces sp. NBC_00444 TaxID=2975744 RepID=UPI0030E0EF40
MSLVLTAAFVASLLVGRREFYAKGDRSNPKLAAAVAVGGLLSGATGRRGVGSAWRSGGSGIRATGGA